MSRAILTLIMLAWLSAVASAEVEPVSIRIPETTAWTGQKVSFFVDLKAKGTFDGTASFSIPQIPQTVVIKVGSPVVSSQQIEGDTWFVQSHEFALFSQQTGRLTIPSFEVRFASRDGFTGPASDRMGNVPATQLEIRRSPGSEELGFLVTASAIEIKETWTPQPGPANVGDVFRRTISQTADQLTGIALAPPPQTESDAVRIYSSDPQVTDDTERGSYIGRRQDTLTYVPQTPGTHTLPAITYVWWNSKTEKLRSKTLPSVTFEVVAPPAPPVSPKRQTAAWWWWLGGIVTVGGLLIWRRSEIATDLYKCWRWLNPPSHVAARQLLKACHHNDPAAASRAWAAWLNLREPEFRVSDSLQVAALEMESHLYGAKPTEVWRGSEMAHAFREQLRALKERHQRNRAPDLPRLNPR